MQQTTKAISYISQERLGAMGEVGARQARR